jgi:CDP-diacylglycerol--glycerol-3-phosphate 3-phosphatidyltransferase/cardiolipin synthase
MNIPNSLTLIRIGLIPVFVAAFYLPMPSANVVTSVIFAIAALTDWLDGYLARRLGQTSKLGQFLDPVADKLMVAVVLVFLVQRHPSVWLACAAAVIIGREITISALREWMAVLGARRKVAVSNLGKIKTIAQMTAIVLLLYAEPLSALPTYSVGLFLLYVAAVLTLWSMCMYLSLAWPDIRGGQDQG